MNMARKVAHGMVCSLIAAVAVAFAAPVLAEDLSIDVDTTLAEDTDWRSYDNVNVASGISLDLGGQKLYVKSIGGSGTVTNSVAGGELHIDVPADTSVTISSLELVGSLRLVKEGAGTLNAQKYPQSYSGGNDVVQGILRYYCSSKNINSTSGKSPFGSVMTIDVRSGGILDPYGSYNWGNHTVNLYGGVISNTVACAYSTNKNGLNAIINVYADSDIATTLDYTVRGSIRLNGYTLGICIGNGKYLDFAPGITGGGKLSLIAGGWLRNQIGDVTWSGVDIIRQKAAFSLTKAISLHDYYGDYTSNYGKGAGGLKVSGVFTPATDYFYGCAMQNGSTIDLSTRSSAWSTTSSITDSTMTKTVSFASEANVTIDLGDREVASGEKIVSWSSQPTAYFKFAGKYSIVKPDVRADGIYMGSGVGFIVAPIPEQGMESGGTRTPAVVVSNLAANAELVYGVHYTVSYPDSANLEFGSYRAVATGIGDYDGQSYTRTFAVTEPSALKMLPAAYRQVEYIQGDASAARIVTTYTPNPVTDRIETLLMPTAEGKTIFCARGSTTSTANWSMFWWNVSDYFLFYYNSTTAAADSSFATGEIDVDQEYLLVAASNVCSVANRTVSAPKVHSFAPDFTAAGGPVTLFASYYNGTANNKANYSAHRLYSFSVYRDGALFRDYVPCIRRSDSAPGLYERVTGVFHTGAEASGAFAVGPLRTGVQVLPIAAQDYSGSALTPDVTAIDAETGAAIDAANFERVYANNVAPGAVATVRLTGRAGTAYEGVVAEANFTIAPSYRVTAYSLATEGDGLSWDSPMSLTNAIATAIAGDTIMLKAGEYALPAQLVISKGLTIRGGYAGTDGDALDLDHPLSVLTQGAAINVLVRVTATSGTFSMERVQIEKALQIGMQKANAACNFHVSGCNFVSNGFSAVSVAKAAQYGKGLQILGSTASDIVITNCYFAYNCQTNNEVKASGGPGAALQVALSKSATVVDSRFFGNCAFLGPGAKASSASNLYDIFPTGSAIYAPSRIHIRNCDFRANAGHIRGSSTSGGVIWFASGSSGSSVSNCTFIANLDRNSNGGTGATQGGPIVLNLGSSTQYVNIYGSTFAYNLADGTEAAGGITARIGTANIKNCVFGGNHIRRGATKNSSDIKVGDSGVVNISYSVLGYDRDNSVYCNETGVYNEGAGVIYSDPQFVSRPENVTNMITATSVNGTTRYHFPNNRATYDKIAAIDVHLLSAQGYVTNGAETAWLVSDSISPAIDAGDPFDDYSHEPDPNGNRRNAGVYGNTPQASKTKASAIPLGFDNIEVDYPSGYSNPRIRFSVTGDDGVFVEVTISGATEGGDVFSGTLSGCTPGTTYEYYLPDFYVRGTEIAYTISGVSTAGTVTPTEEDFTVEADLPEWWGHGGGETVMHVWSGAPGDGSGRDWHNACRTWNELMVAYAARDVKPDEIWFIDIAAPSQDAATLSITSPVVMRGGFTYFCDSISDRVDGAISTLSARRSYSLAKISNGSGSKVTIERIEFTRSTAQGLYKSGAGDLDIHDCRFYMNSYNVNNVSGRGLYVAGSASSTRVSVSNCVFAANGMFTGGGYDGGYGSGAYFANLARVTLDDCLFVTNGAMRTVDYPTGATGGDNTQGSAVYFSNAPLTARNCAFLANQGADRDNGYNSGGAIRFAGNCDGSVMTNCVVAGCSDRRGWASTTGQPGYHGGAITVTMGSSAYAIDLVNVTIAYNLSDGIACPGGINLFTGTVNLKNSIVFGNFCSHNALAGNRFGADVDVKEGGVLNAEYTLFTEDSTNSISYAEGATVNLGQGVIYGDPLFATSFATVRSRVAYPFGSNYTYFDTTAANVGRLAQFNVHLRGGRGYYDEKTGELVREYRTQEVISPAQDAGDRNSSFAQERDCLDGWHGRRVNLGAYGNTPWATMTAFPGGAFRLR